MKHYKPGQFASIRGIVYRAHKRTDGCKGCVLDDLLLCPCIIDKRYEQRTIDCSLDGIIFKRQ